MVFNNKSQYFINIVYLQIPFIHVCGNEDAWCKLYWIIHSWKKIWGATLELGSVKTPYEG